VGISGGKQMSIKINKNGKEYDLGFVPQSLYDDVEDLKDAVSNLIKTDFYFNGTPDSNGVIITDVPLATYTPLNIVPLSVSRIGWEYSFVCDINKSSTYWYIKLSGTPSGTYSGRIVAIKN